MRAHATRARENEVLRKNRGRRFSVRPANRVGKSLLQRKRLIGRLLGHLFLSTKRLIAAFGSSVAIESASQSRAWLIVSCQARSFQKFKCCFA